MANEWDEYAAEWEQDESTTIFAQNVFQQLQKLASLNGKHVFDFGCGTGLLSQLMSPQVKDIVALDSSEAMIEELDKKELSNVEPVVDFLTRGLVAQHPAFRKQFDLVVASSVCGFVPNLSEVLTIIHSLLDDNGLFVHWDWLVAEDDPEYGLSQRQIETLLKDAGFGQVETSVAFEMQTKNGLAPVVMGVGRK
ncbi:class I SAM-dependent DNA methyltransferase [Vibrio aestuarianus]|uniref:class I SAM-dependent DNA methyltransferase n=1 Tax=Vibrio aestuarianus TaxID=28171 RepID=UPI00237CE794|nr:class I SAM-dependent methyltransferase [Vibrio aestuarianus]MDE1211028.1 class I SAM-dependent methyltransferase [Vibrio aestuarianus]MDE1222295.1 class I SAM-dependent methyltransferase [Vibrio aestuarianus]MDE1324742.1 class I SAM-dependent methyltransferase [Vibrio aestuarianus]MDE1339632.1 class I SAM-dependent methyltransferase [Vibrio aestuarianus]